MVNCASLPAPAGILGYTQNVTISDIMSHIWQHLKLAGPWFELHGMAVVISAGFEAGQASDEVKQCCNWALRISFR